MSPRPSGGSCCRCRHRDRCLVGVASLLLPCQSGGGSRCRRRRRRRSCVRRGARPPLSADSMLDHEIERSVFAALPEDAPRWPEELLWQTICGIRQWPDKPVPPWGPALLLLEPPPPQWTDYTAVQWPASGRVHVRSARCAPRAATAAAGRRPRISVGV